MTLATDIDPRVRCCVASNPACNAPPQLPEKFLTVLTGCTICAPFALCIHFHIALHRSIHSDRIDGVIGVFRRIVPLLLTAFVLASCSINPSAKNSSAPLPPLCRSIPSLSTLTVNRSVFAPNQPVQFTFPATVTVSNETQVQIVAKALCKLPHISRTTNCPSGPPQPFWYDFTFLGQGKTFPLVRLILNGCDAVQGLIKGQWVLQSPKFWRTLGTAMGLKGATQATFAGKSTSVG